MPGTYVVSGDFRVFTGARLKRSGSCLSFTFKIEGQRQVFTARWCQGYGIVPWQGRDIRASVSPRQSRSGQDLKKTQNFKSRFEDGGDF
jgi:hypothetical protein